MALNSVTQYIGARYVPKFYENSDDTSEWRPGVIYEPLTIVTWNNNSYTSKRPVPAEIGAPNENPRYWVATGNYNEQIQSLIDRFDALPIVNPADYGAVGDGVTDDSAAIRTAGEAGIIYGDGKTYYLGSSVELLYGSIDANYYLAEPASVTSTGGDGKVWFNNKFHKNPNDFQTETRGKWALVIKNTNNAIVSGNEFYNCVSCLYLDRLKNVVVEDNFFHDIPQTAYEAGGNGYGVLTVECYHTVICNNYFLDVARHAVYISHDDTSIRSQFTEIYGNTFKWTSAVSGATDGFDKTIAILPTLDISIHDNIFDGVMGICHIIAEIIPRTGGAWTGSERVYIYHNQCYNLHNVPRPTDGAVYITRDVHTRYSVRNIHITDNVFTKCSVPIVVTSDGDQIYIERNTVINDGASRLYFAYFTMMSDQNYPTNVYIRNNDIDYSSAMAFYFAAESEISEIGINISELEISGNNIKCKSLFNMTDNTTVNVFTFRNNKINAESEELYTRNFKPLEVYADGNASNIKQGFYWRATLGDNVVKSWDNVLFRPVIPGNAWNSLQVGTVVAAVNGKVYIVDKNNTFKEV